MRPIFRQIFIGSWLIVLLAGCTTTPAPQPPAAAPSAQPPAPGTGGVVGQAVGTTTRAPIPKTVIYLAQVYWNEDHTRAAYALDIANSPATRTDANGFFSFADVPPNEYVIVVGDYYGENDVVRESNGDARVLRVEADKILDAGVVAVKPTVSPG